MGWDSKSPWQGWEPSQGTAVSLPVVACHLSIKRRADLWLQNPSARNGDLITEAKCKRHCSQHLLYWLWPYKGGFYFLAWSARPWTGKVRATTCPPQLPEGPVWSLLWCMDPWLPLDHSSEWALCLSLLSLLHSSRTLHILCVPVCLLLLVSLSFSHRAPRQKLTCSNSI